MDRLRWAVEALDSEPGIVARAHGGGWPKSGRYLFNNTSQDILALAGAMLDGELEYRRGQFDAAFEHLRRAIALDDALP